MRDSIDKWERDTRDMAAAQGAAFRLRQEVEALRAELAQVTAERDALLAVRTAPLLAA